MHRARRRWDGDNGNRQENSPGKIQNVALFLLRRYLPFLAGFFVVFFAVVFFAAAFFGAAAFFAAFFFIAMFPTLLSWLCPRWAEQCE